MESFGKYWWVFLIYRPGMLKLNFKFLDEKAHLFTGALYNNYQPPPGFCFDILCADEPIIDGKHSPDNNVNQRVSSLNYFPRVEI